MTVRLALLAGALVGVTIAAAVLLIVIASARTARRERQNFKNITFHGDDL